MIRWVALGIVIWLIKKQTFKRCHLTIATFGKSILDSSNSGVKNSIRVCGWRTYLPMGDLTPRQCKARRQYKSCPLVILKTRSIVSNIKSKVRVMVYLSALQLMVFSFPCVGSRRTERQIKKYYDRERCFRTEITAI